MQSTQITDIYEQINQAFGIQEDISLMHGFLTACAICYEQEQCIDACRLFTSYFLTDNKTSGLGISELSALFLKLKKSLADGSYDDLLSYSQESNADLLNLKNFAHGVHTGCLLQKHRADFKTKCQESLEFLNCICSISMDDNYDSDDFQTVNGELLMHIYKMFLNYNQATEVKV